MSPTPQTLRPGHLGNCDLGQQPVRAANGQDTPGVVIAVDVGGTTMKAALVDTSGRTVQELVRPTFSVDGDPLATLQGLLHELNASAREQGFTPVAAGVVTPGLVNDETGVVEFAANLRWRDLALGPLLRNTLQLPVTVSHDARAAGRAEYLLAGNQPETFALVPIGTGISAAFIAHGRAIAGATHAAGEFGHVPVHQDGEPCACGQRGCLEAYASGSAIISRYRRLGGLGAQDTADVVQLLGQDPLADSVWAEAVDALCTGLIMMTMMFDPDVIVIGGGLSNAGSVLVTPLQERLSARLVWRDAPQVTQSTLGPLAGRTGAAVIAYEGAGLISVPHRWNLESVIRRAA